MSHSKRPASVLDATVTDAALADAQAAAVALGNAIIDKLADVAPAPIVAYTFEDARVRTLAILRAIAAGDAPTTMVGELDGLMAALEAAAPPPPVHEDSCQTFKYAAALAEVMAKGIGEDVAEIFARSVPSACNCKASKPKRASAASGTRGTPTRVVPIGTAAVTYLMLDGATKGMSLAQAATQAAADYPAAERCAAYVKGITAKQSLNARGFLRADVDKARIPAGIVVFAGDPEPEAVAPIV